MIATVTPNPCIDYNVQVDELVRNETARAKGALVFPGGIGVNVARAVKVLGDVPVKAYGFAGGHTGAWLKALLDEEGVEHDFIDSELPTRINVLTTLTPDRSLVRVNAAGPELGEALAKQLVKQLTGLDRKPDIVVLGGSLPGRRIPPAIPHDWYARIIDELRTKKVGAKVVVDCRQPNILGHAVSKGPYLVKPNVAELARLAGDKELATEKDIIVAAEGQMGKYGIEYFVVSRGAEGCVVVGKNERYKVTPPDAVALTRVAAGDAFVGGLCWALAKNEPIDIAAKYAVTVGTATVLSPAAALFRKDEVEKLLAKTSVERL